MAARGDGRRLDRRPALRVYVLARLVFGAGVAAGHEDLAVACLEQHGEPRHVSPDDALGDVTVAAAGAIVDDVDQCRLAGFRRAGDDVQLADPEGQLPDPTVVAVENDIGNLEGHGTTPHAAKMV